MSEVQETKKGLGLHARRVIAYVVLCIITFFCLFWFYVLFINATRSNGELQAGFTLAPSSHLWENWLNLVHGTLPVWRGMFNSLFVATCSAALCVYFSTMTAYAIHAYEFKLKPVYPDDHDDPDTGNSTWFRTVGFQYETGGQFHTIDRSFRGSTGYLLLYETVHGEFLAVIFDRGSAYRWFR